ncbi:MAG TPA: hypothetical protein VKE42_07475, partial [Candidatus Cybelea sp.]|nr:hypothetical protein [Candidatus Cybelea sp.]
ARLHRIPNEMTSALLVGHNPAVEQLARQLVKVASALPEKFPTGAVADLRVRIRTWTELDFGICRLHEFVTPRKLG